MKRKNVRLQDFVFAVVDTKPVQDVEKRNGYKYEFLGPFLSYLETELDENLPYPSSVMDMHKMFDYKIKLNTLKDRYKSIGLDCVSDVDQFLNELNEMRLEWTEFKTWYVNTAYELRKRYYKSVLREDNSQNVSTPTFTSLDSLKEKIKQANQNSNF